MKIREYSILFLILQKQQKVHMQISFAQNHSSILRKHWCGEIPETKEHFSCKNPQAKPEMLVWNIGYVTREEAKAFLQKWEGVFLQKGFQIIGSQLTDDELKDDKWFRQHRNMLKQINFENLMQGVGVQKVVCGENERIKKTASQKYTVKTAEEMLNIRTTWEVASLFRSFCKENGLTQNQGLLLLLEMADNGNNSTLLVQDLQGRLGRADERIANNTELICRLYQEIQEEKESKKRPREVDAARIQNMLINKFFAYLPIPEFSEAYLKRYSAKMSKEVFPERTEYHYPDKEGVYLLYLEHITYSKGHRRLLFIYGKTEAGEKIKLCYPYAREHRYGQTLWDSPYLIQGYPWGFGVQKPKEIAYIIASLPLFDLNRISDWYVEKEIDDDFFNEPMWEEKELSGVEWEEEKEIYEPEGLDERIEFYSNDGFA